MGFVPGPLHLVHLKSDLVSGIFKVGYPDIAGGRVLPMLEVLDCPEANGKPNQVIQAATLSDTRVSRAF